MTTPPPEVLRDFGLGADDLAAWEDSGLAAEAFQECVDDRGQRPLDLLVGLLERTQLGTVPADRADDVAAGASLAPAPGWSRLGAPRVHRGELASGGQWWKGDREGLS